MSHESASEAPLALSPPRSPRGVPSSGPVSVPSLGRGRGRGAPVGGSRVSPPPRPLREEEDRLAYLEQLVPSLQSRLAASERALERLQGELDEARRQLERGSSSPPVSPKGGAPAAASSPESPHGAMQRRPSQVWVATGSRRATTTSAAAAANPPNPLAASAPAMPTAMSTGRGFQLGGRRKEGLVDERGKAVERFVDSERRYNQRLTSIVTMYADPVRRSLGKSPTRDDSMQMIFVNSDMILAVHKLLLGEILNRWSRWTSTSCIGDIVGKYVPLFSLYRDFCRSSSGRGQMNFELLGSDAPIVQRIVTQASDANTEELSQLFAAIRRRLKEYLNSFRDVNTETDPAHPDFEPLQQVIRDIEVIMETLNPAPAQPPSGPPTLASSPSAQDQRAVGLGRLRSSSGTGSNDKSSSSIAVLLRKDKKSSKIKGTFGKSSITQTGRFGTKKDRTAYEMQQRILADIQEREQDPNLSEEERAQLRLQSEYAAQGNFEAALNVMAGKTPDGVAGASSGRAGSSSGSGAGDAGAGETIDPADFEEAFQQVLNNDAGDTAFDRNFLSMYFYFVSWRTLLGRIIAAYNEVRDLGTAESVARCNRIMHILSVWLESNPHLRTIQTDDGPKKKKKPVQPPPEEDGKESQEPTTPSQERLPPPPAVKIVSDETATTESSPMARRKPLPLPPAPTTEPRTPDETDTVIVELCVEIQNALDELHSALDESNDSSALDSTKQVTEVVLRLVDTTQDEKEETEPAFVEEAHAMRGNVVQLTQSIVNVIKSSFSPDSLLAIRTCAAILSEKSANMMDMALATERVIEVPSEEESRDEADDDNEEDTASGSIINALLGRNGGSDKETLKRNSAVYQAAMNTNLSAASDSKKNAPPLGRQDSSPSVREDDTRTFVEIMQEFISSLASRPSERGFIAFFQAWLNMGTADENFRKVARRKSHNLMRAAQLGPRPDSAGNAGNSEAPFTMDLLREVTPTRIAQQMAVLEYQLFQVIPTEELFLSRFMDSQRAPNFSLLVSQFNVWGRWAYSEVLRRSDVSERAKMIGFFITVAKESLAMNNFNTSYALVAGLNFPGLGRLKNTWQKVSKRDLDNYESLLSFWNTSRNYKTYRAALKAAIPPAVPWFGLVAKDLFHIEDSSPTFVTDEKDGIEKINFSKLNLISKAVSFLATLQKYEFSHRPDPIIQKLLSDVKRTVATEDEGMQLSYSYEAKTTGGAK